MTDSGKDQERGNSSEPEWRKRFRNKYPKLSHFVFSFLSNPLSGEGAEAALSDDEINREFLIESLTPPSMWASTSSVVISQFTSYNSSKLVQYWTSTVPELQSQYGDEIRYVHHDIPTVDKDSLEYKVATIGRVLQKHDGDDVFWKWFNSVIVDGVSDIDQAYEVACGVSETVSRKDLERSVSNDVARSVFEDDINTLFGRVDASKHSELDTGIHGGEPVFMVFINGVHVQASYDVMVGVIEEAID